MGSGRTYSNDEIQYIKENWEYKTDCELSKVLNRPVGSIIDKRKQLGLTRNNRKYSFNDVILEFNKTDYILISSEEDYLDSAQKTIRYLCPKHEDKGIQLISLAHLQSGRGCYFCGREKTEQSRKINIENNKDIISLCAEKGFVFQNAYRNEGKIYVNYICTKHTKKGIQTMQYQNMKRDFVCGCPFCGMTSGEKAVMDCLELYNIKYIPQYKFNDLKCVDKLRFDYYLPDYNKVIEYDGIQHFEPTRFNGISYERAKQNLEVTINHDTIKNNYCRENGIPILRIPFFKYNEINDMIIDFIKE